MVQSLARLGLNKMLDALDDRQDGVVIIDGFRKLRFKHERFLIIKAMLVKFVAPSSRVTYVSLAVGL